jgi:Ca-activated chloride channel family protein
MHWGAPYFLFLLLLVPILAVMIGSAGRYRRRRFRRFAEDRFYTHFLRELSNFHWMLKHGLLILALALLIVAAARPQWNRKDETVKRRGVDIVICFDISKSMDAQDVAPSRLTMARDDLTRLLDKLDGDRVALVTFAGRSFLQFPLTDDYDAVRLFLNTLDTQAITYWGTDLGSAITTAGDLFESGGGQKDRVILVVSDGEDLEAGAIDAAKKVRQKGVRIFTLGVGTPQGGPIPDEGAYIKDAANQTVVSHLDVQTLNELARVGDGKTFLVSTRQAEVDDLAGTFDRLRKGEYEGKEAGRYQDQYRWFAIPALVLLLVEGLIHYRRRVPAERMIDR